MSPPTGPNQAAFAAEASVDTDVFCRRCGYNLRGLSLDGRCPECGTLVHLSLRGDLLRFSDPQWLLMLSRGTSLLAYGTVACVAAILCQRIALNSIVRPSIRDAILVLFSSAPIGGVWLLTTSDPSRAGEKAYAQWRRLTRILLPIALATALLYSVTKKSPLSPDIHGLLLLVTALGSIASVGEIVVLLKFIRGLSRRLPDASIERLTKWLVYLCPAAAIMSVILESIRASKTVTTLRPFHNRLLYDGFTAHLLRLCAGATLLADFILGVIFLVLVVHLGRRLRDQRAYSLDLGR